MGAARGRLIVLALSWFAAMTADHALLAALARPLGGTTFAAALILILAPFVVLAPLNGFVVNRFGVRAMLLVTSAVKMVLGAGIIGVGTALESLMPALPLLALHLAAVGTAASLTATLSVLPAAAEEARFPLSRVTGIYLVATLAAGIAGVRLAAGLHHEPERLALLVAGLYLAAAGFAWPTHFVAENRRWDSLRVGVQRFDFDARLLARCDSYGFLQAQMVFSGSAAWLVTLWLEAPAWPLLGGMFVGVLVAGLSGHPTRVLGWIPWGLSGLVIALVLAGTLGPGPVLVACIGALLGLVQTTLMTGYLFSLPATARTSGAALSMAAGLAAALGGVFVAWMLAGAPRPSPGDQLLILAGAALAAAVVGWRRRFRDALELLATFIFLPVYRIRVVGPGVGRFPREGPVLVIANHAAWFDPLWLGKVVPRRLTPMMASRFFDLPIIHWLMRRAIRAIRVQESAYRRQVPELTEAAERLDRGECVVLFPEGMLRRREEVLLNRFGQGLWYILSRRPQTPVVACWIEGGWRSFTSYWNGPPGAHKRFDWFWPITIVMDEPREAPPEVLQSHKAARIFYGERVLALRSFLTGLKPASGEVAPAPGEKNGAERVSP